MWRVSWFLTNAVSNCPGGSTFTCQFQDNVFKEFKLRTLMSQPDLQLTSFYSTISQYANESLSFSPVIVRLLCNFWPKTKIAKVRGLIYDGNCTNCRAVQLFAAIKSFALGQKIIDRKFARDFGTRRLNF